MQYSKSRFLFCIFLAPLLFCFAGCQRQEKNEFAEELPEVMVVKARRRRLKTEIDLPGNFAAYQDVPVHAKVEGYIKWIGVDRGSIVKKGQEMIVVVAPEVDAKVKEAMAKLKATEARYQQAQQALKSASGRLVEAKAKLDADLFTFSRLKEAYDRYAAAVAKNDIDVSGKTTEADAARVGALNSEVEAARKLVNSESENVSAAKNLYDAVKTLHSYLDISAPFDGVISERNVHVGSIVSVSARRTGEVLPLVRIQELDLLRLVVAVPEAAVAGVHIGDKIFFTVPAFPSRTFVGTVARPAYALTPSTRTMPVELNYFNPKFELQPGMYATVRWPFTRPYDTVFLPESAVRTDLKGNFVLKVDNDRITQLKVSPGQEMDGWVEVMGDVREGDVFVLKASGELKSGAKIKTRVAAEDEIKNEIERASAGAGGE